MLLPVFDDEEVDKLLELGRAQCCFLCLMTRRWTCYWSLREGTVLLPVFDDEEVDWLLELGRAQCCFLCLMTRRWTGYWS